MTISVFDIFKLGVGPSSSHTMGPMTAAARFVAHLRASSASGQVSRIAIKLYGSLALTGRGHATDRAVILGLLGHEPANFDPDMGERALATVASHGLLRMGDSQTIAFDPSCDIAWAERERLPHHPNALRFSAFNSGGSVLAARTYYSIGGGFVLDQDEINHNDGDADDLRMPFAFTSAAQLLDLADAAGLTIAEVVFANERAHLDGEALFSGLDRIYAAMEACIERGLRKDGLLPGGLNVRRRAKQALGAIMMRTRGGGLDPLEAMDFVSVWALAVNEENAAGGRVVTAPTNGAAGIVPAVLRFYDRYYNGDRCGRHSFLLTAAAIASLYKRNASISGAEVGCQGEVGVACSMAAAGLAAALGATNTQIENAAEIGMEHNLGLTCDPIGGLVQIPCIERNAMGATKAIDAARLALLGDGEHSVSLDKVIATMKRTGADMNAIYKETSLGGLAVNVVEC